MKNSPSLTTCIIGAIIAVSLFSWLGNIYGLPVTNLISADGMRWVLQSTGANVLQTPLSDILILLIGVGAASHSGLFAFISHYALPQRGKKHNSVLKPTLRQRRAAMYALTALFCFLMLIVADLSDNDSILSGFTGGLAYSSFIEGFPLLFSTALIITGSIYGHLSGNLQGNVTLQQGMEKYISRLAPAIVLLVFNSQLLAALDYTRISFLLAIPPETPLRIGINQVVYYLPFLYYGFTKSGH